MFHAIIPIQDDYGNAINGWQVELADAAGVVQPLFADDGVTPIFTVSGIVNRAVSGTGAPSGTADFWVGFGTYTTRYYDRTGVLVRTLAGMGFADADAGLRGDLATSSGASAQGVVHILATSVSAGGALPFEVTALSGSFVATGTGGTPGEYALTVTGGPAGHSAFITIGGDGKIASARIGAQGISTLSTAPTYALPAGTGLTGGTLPTPTVSALTAGRIFQAPSADGSQLLGWQSAAGVIAAWNVGGIQYAAYQKAGVDTAVSNSIGGSLTGLMLSNKPDTQLMPTTDVRLASNWTLASSSAGPAVQTGAVVNLDTLAFPVPGLFGYSFTLQDNTREQRVEIVSPQYTPLDLSDAGFVAGDIVTMAIFARNFSVDPLNAAKYVQFGFNFGTSRVAIPMNNAADIGNGWVCYYVQRTLSASDLVDSATSGSINGFMLRTQGTATDTFTGTLACPLIFKGRSRGFLRFLQEDIAAAIQGVRQQIIETGLAGAMVSFVGDSRTIQGQVATPAYLTARSYVHWLRMLSRQRFDTTAALNFGQSGWRTDQILAALPGYITSMRAARVQVCCLLAGTNDLGATNPATGSAYIAAGTIANLQAMVNLLLAAGIRVVIQNETPRTGLGGALNTQHNAVKAGIEAMHNPMGGVAVAYTWQALADGTDPTIAASWTTVDGTHMTQRGCYAQGNTVLTALAMFIPQPREIVPRDSVQMIARYGNMLANPFMAGAGTVADNWTYTNSAGGTAAVTNSLVTIAGKVWQRAALSGTPSGSDASPLFHRWTQNIDIYAGQFVAGDVIDSCLEVMVETPSGLRSFDYQLVGPNIFDGACDTGGATAGYQLGPDSYSGVLRTLPVTLTGAPANLQMRVRAVGVNGVATGGNVYFRLAEISRLNR